MNKELLKAMYLLLKTMNNEEAYLGALEIFIDEASEEDFDDLAIDDDNVKEHWETFYRTVKKYGDDGLCLDDQR